MSKKLKIYFTSDTHGYLFPVDYPTGKAAATGLLGCMGNFTKDGNTLIIDGGDTLQGSPFATFVANRNQNPVATIFNQAGYDYITLGNHDFNHGPEYLAQYLHELDADCICANVESDFPVLPYHVHTLENGLCVGLVGIVTDFVNIWEKPEHLQNISVNDPFAAAAAALEELKKQGVDLTVCIYHGGFECDLTTEEILTNSAENIAYRLCKELDFDLLLTGHQHLAIEGGEFYGTYFVQPAPYASHFLVISAEISENGVVFSSFFQKPTTPIIVSREIMELEEQTQRWLDEPAGSLLKPFDEGLSYSDKVKMALNGTELTDFFNHVMLEYTGADIACVSLGNVIKPLSESVSIRDILAAYVFPDTLNILQITGEILKVALERVASYLELGENGEPRISRAFLMPKVSHYNYDYFAGITFHADLRKPVGGRIEKIVTTSGRTVLPSDEFKICMNQYRAHGGGGFDVYRRGKILTVGDHEITDLIIKFLKNFSPVKVCRYSAPVYFY
ncbi:MAG: bifunctional metallophosphatase/5'-nucleotidase [Turicibacter sp.]|nr:bifunctional metallophosphatase/5'-nucleotidase [Turicibacter sp.]